MTERTLKDIAQEGNRLLHKSKALAGLGLACCLTLAELDRDGEGAAVIEAGRPFLEALTTEMESTVAAFERCRDEAEPRFAEAQELEKLFNAE